MPQKAVPMGQIKEVWRLRYYLGLLQSRDLPPLERVASHVRSLIAYHHSAVRQHMPKSHHADLEWTPSRLIHWGQVFQTSFSWLIL